ncbi:NACHT domain-containing protein [Streptomyces sp. KS_5]|nr:NACHT domain-containing protein [Streptomyces sp. KS_5]
MNTWEKEEAALRLYDPKAIPVRWHAASAALQDEWATIRNRTDDEPVDLDGHFADILSTYRKLLPSGRLVVLGDPGAGKSVLAVRFLLDHLTYRSKHNPTAPVAVLLSLSSWNPDQPFWDWAANRIARDYPQLADMGGTGSSVAAQLLEKGRLLLVLDGFDELPVQARPRALDALNDRNRNTGKLLLTSRRAEYEEAVGTAGVLSAAAVIELEPLGVEDLEHFLPLTVRGKGDMGNKDDQDVSGSTDDQDVSGSTDGSSSKDGSKWAGVLDVLSGTLPAPGHDPQPEPKPESDPGAESSPDGVDLRARAAVLRQVLSTPLMVALARTAYSDTAACPRELLESKQLGTTEDVEDHLLDQFVTVVYHRPPDTHAAATDRWTADEARSWLSGLARRLQRLGLHEITWWRLSPGVPEACRLVVESAALALTLGATGWLVFGQPHRPQEPPPPYVLGVQAAACLIALLTRPLGTGDTGVAPRRLVLRGRLRAFASQAAIATAVVLPVGLAQQVTPAVLAALPVLFALHLAGGQPQETAAGRPQGGDGPRPRVRPPQRRSRRTPLLAAGLGRPRPPAHHRRLAPNGRPGCRRPPGLDGQRGEFTGRPRPARCRRVCVVGLHLHPRRPRTHRTPALGPRVLPGGRPSPGCAASGRRRIRVPPRPAAGPARGWPPTGALGVPRRTAASTERQPRGPAVCSARAGRRELHARRGGPVRRLGPVLPDPQPPGGLPRGLGCGRGGRRRRRSEWFGNDQLYVDGRHGHQFRTAPQELVLGAHSGHPLCRLVQPRLRHRRRAARDLPQRGRDGRAAVQPASRVHRRAAERSRPGPGGGDQRHDGKSRLAGHALRQPRDPDDRHGATQRLPLDGREYRRHPDRRAPAPVRRDRRCPSPWLRERSLVRQCGWYGTGGGLRDTRTLAVAHPRSDGGRDPAADGTDHQVRRHAQIPCLPGRAGGGPRRRGETDPHRRLRRSGHLRGAQRRLRGTHGRAGRRRQPQHRLLPQHRERGAPRDRSPGLGVLPSPHDLQL